MKRGVSPLRPSDKARDAVWVALFHDQTATAEMLLEGAVLPLPAGADRSAIYTKQFIVARSRLSSACWRSGRLRIPISGKGTARFLRLPFPGGTSTSPASF